jgi:cytochrome oxidase Cu insertion factor (SCO1/SenC/PrrC family)
MKQPNKQAGRVNQALVLAGLFLGPLFLAAIAYLGPWEFVPDGSTANGVLVDPIRPLPALIGLPEEASETADQRHWLRGRWSLIYVINEPCNDACAARVTAMGQIYKALMDDRLRVQRVLVHPADVEFPADAGWVDVPVADAVATRLAAELAAADPGPLYVTDPLGNLVLAYAGDARDKGILKDLQRLLKLSRIG